MASIFENKDIFANAGVFSAEGDTPAPAAAPAPVTVDPNDGTTTVVVESPDTHTPDGSSDLEKSGDITLITEPDEDDDGLIDIDDDEASEDVTDCVDQADEELEQILKQGQAIEAIQQNGVDPLAIGMLQRAGLLSQTALGGMSRESFDGAFVGSAEAGLSQEGLANMAADAGKALLHGGEATAATAAVVGGNLLRRFGVLRKAVTEATEGAEKAATAALDRVAEKAATAGADHVAADAAAGSAKDAIKSGTEAAAAKVTNVLSAKNAILAAAAAAAVAGGVAMLLRSVPASTATAEAKNAYFSKVVTWVKGIHLPWAKLDVTTGEGGEAAGKLVVNGKPVSSAAAAAEEAAAKAGGGVGGWTKEAVDAAKGKISGIGKSIGGAFDGLAGKFSALTGAGEAAGKAASEQVAAKGGSPALAKAAGVFAHGSYVAGVFTILALIASVIYFAVVGGLRLVRKSAQG